MTFFDAPARGAPQGLAKLLALNWALVLLLTAVACTGFLMLFSVAGGSLEPWAEPQMLRFAVGLAGMVAIGMIDIPLSRSTSWASSAWAPSAGSTSARSRSSPPR
jgi:rod shape determining protein RodA